MNEASKRTADSIENKRRWRLATIAPMENEGEKNPHTLAPEEPSEADQP